MSISLSVLLYIYFTFLFFWAIFSLVALYHMIKFSFKSFTSFLSIIVYLSGSLGILAVSYFFISQIDWSREIFFSIFNSGSIY